MEGRTAALAATQALRRSEGWARLGLAERASLDHDLQRVERALSRAADPFAVPMETPADLRMPSQRGTAPTPALSPPAPAAVPRAGTEVIGDRARQALAAVDFPSFVAGLVNGTFQAIVDATAQQVRDYATLVASLSRSVDEFSRDNVGPDQVREWLAGRHPRDLGVVLPRDRATKVRLVPKRSGGEPPTWLEQYGLGGQDLTAELADGPLVDAGRRHLAEERMQTLATMVLMGINRIVVDDGQIKARLQFHATAKESVAAQIAVREGGENQGIEARQVGARSSVSAMVSTVSVNAQADVAIKADLMGEVSIKFRTETFDLDRFADSQAIQLIQRHARTPGPTAGGAPTPGGGTPGGGAPGGSSGGGAT